MTKNNNNDDDYNGDDYNGDGFRAKFPQFSNTHNQQQSMSLTIIMMMDIFIFSAYRPALCNTICTNEIELLQSSRYIRYHQVLFQNFKITHRG